MTAKLNAFLERLHKTNTPNDLQTLVENLRDVYDIGNAVYHAVNIGGSPYAAVTYDPRWGDHYHESNYVKIDPGRSRSDQAVPSARLEAAGLVYSRRARLLARSGGFRGRQPRLLNPDPRPERQFALFTINDTGSDEQWRSFTREYGRDMLLISHYMHQKVLEVLNADEMTAPAKELSPRERDALSMLGTGESRSRIADALNISEHTLRVYIDSARHKLGRSTRPML